MVLTRNQRDRLRGAVLPSSGQPLFTIEQLRVALAMGSEKSYDRIVGNGSTLDQAWLQIEQNAESDGWEGQLVKGLFEALPNNRLLRDIYQEIYVQAAENGPQFDRCWINGVPFANRTRLREHVQSLAAGDGRRVLLVLGDSGTGKSHSRHLIQYVADAHRHRRAFVRIDVIKKISPDRVAIDVASQFGADVSSMPEQGVLTEPAWVLELARQIEQIVIRSGVAHWIIFDNFRKPLHKGTRDLILELAQRAEINRTGLRIVLLGFSRQLPPDVHNAAAREEIAPVTPEDLVACIQCARVERNRPAADAVQVRTEVNRILSLPVPKGQTPYQVISEELALIIQRL